MTPPWWWAKLLTVVSTRPITMTTTKTTPSAPQPRLAFSYSRISTPEQQHGQGLQRQAEMVEKHCRQHELTLSPLVFTDVGKSGYYSKNLEGDAALARFLRAVEDGEVPRGSVLLCEDLDRLSRAPARKVAALLSRIVDEGIEVHTVGDGQVYTSARLDEEPFAFLMVVLIAQRANAESRLKSSRLRAVNEAKRQAARETGKRFTSRAPGWLQPDDHGGFKLIPERAAIVRRIVKLYVGGLGAQGIADLLRSEGVQGFGLRNRTYFTRNNILGILDSPVIIGTFVPHTVAFVGGRKTRVPTEAIEGYYPACISPEDYLAVRLLRDHPTGAHGYPHRGTRKTPLVNPFAGLLRCACGAALMRRSKGVARNGRQAVYLRCSATLDTGCTAGAGWINAHTVETAVLNRLGYLATKVTASSRASAKLERQLDETTGALDVAQDRAQAAAEALLGAPGSPSLLEALREAEDHVASLKTEAAELEARLGMLDAPALKARLAGLQEALAEVPMVPARVNAALRLVVDSIVVTRGAAEVHWRTGQTQTVALTFGPD